MDQREKQRPHRAAWPTLGDRSETAPPRGHNENHRVLRPELNHQDTGGKPRLWRWSTKCLASDGSAVTVRRSQAHPRRGRETGLTRRGLGSRPLCCGRGWGGRLGGAQGYSPDLGVQATGSRNTHSTLGGRL